MFRPRIIPVLLLKGNALVKSKGFKDFRYVGDPINAVKVFNDLKADELVFLDTEATKEKRTIFLEQYIDAYNSEPIRIATIMYDLIGLLSYIVNNKLTLKTTLELLNEKELFYEGIDGKFSFDSNLIKRELNILKIQNGSTALIK